MKKRAKLLLAGAVALGSISFGAPAHASDASVCVVSGTVSLLSRTNASPLPLNSFQRKGAYQFIDTNIQCNGTISATYKVTAAGTTTGFPDSSVGEDCNAGQSDTVSATATKSNGTTVVFNNKLNGTKVAGDSGAPNSLTGDVIFTRLGSAVHVSGTLTNNLAYAADLQFTPGDRQNDLPNPSVDQALGCAPGASGGVTTAALDGTAIVYSL